MERVEQLLREELWSMEAKVTEPTDVTLAQVARVRRRRRIRRIGALAGVAVVIAAAALVGPMALRDRIPAAASTPVYSNELMRAIFRGEIGYVLQQRCTTTGKAKRCKAQLLVTTDGGRAWHPRYLPTEPGIAGPYRDPSGRALSLWMENDELAVAGPDQRFWTSADDAITWREADSRRSEESRGRVGVVDAREQAVFLLPPTGGFPPTRDGGGQIAAARDDSFWLACSDRPCAMVTRDYGRSWAEIPVGGGAEPVDWVATFDGQTVYASVGTAVLRSTDRGLTWSEVARRPGSTRSVAGVVTADGTLALTEGRGGTAFRLAAGATELDPLPNIGPRTAYLYGSGTWLVASAGAERREDNALLGSIVAVSADNGSTWQTLPPPAA